MNVGFSNPKRFARRYVIRIPRMTIWNPPINSQSIQGETKQEDANQCLVSLHGCINTEFRRLIRLRRYLDQSDLFSADSRAPATPAVERQFHKAQILLTASSRANPTAVGWMEATIHEHFRQKFHHGSAFGRAQKPFGAVAVS